jgi:hypothetical protein
MPEEIEGNSRRWGLNETRLGPECSAGRGAAVPQACATTSNLNLIRRDVVGSTPVHLADTIAREARCARDLRRYRTVAERSPLKHQTSGYGPGASHQRGGVGDLP